MVGKGKEGFTCKGGPTATETACRRFVRHAQCPDHTTALLVRLEHHPTITLQCPPCQALLGMCQNRHLVYEACTSQHCLSACSVLMR